MTEDFSFKPSGQVRPNTLYVSHRLYKALGYIARKTGQGREDLVEVVLAAWVALEHPEIEAWITQRENDEREFAKKLKPQSFETTSVAKESPRSDGRGAD